MFYMYNSPYDLWSNNQKYRDRSVKVKKPRMVLEGIGTIKVDPDIAVIILGVTTEGDRVEVIQRENGEKVQQIIESLMRTGLEKRNIETESYSIVPQYDYVERKQIFKGYRVTNTLKITVSNIEEVGRIIDIAVENGANVVNSVNFLVSKSSNYYKIALSKAVIDAVDKAINMEKTLNIIVDRIPIDISEESSSKNIFEGRRELMASTVSTPIIGGEIEITAKVKAIFRYRKL